jgi:hypothetical protein
LTVGPALAIETVMGKRDQPGKRHPLYRAIRATWWVLAIWLATAVLVGVIRGTFVSGPAATPDLPAVPADPAASSGG